MNIIMDAHVTERTSAGPVSPIEAMAADLAKSGLVYQDTLSRILDGDVINALGATHNTSGYVIPYFNMTGKILPFYRAKVLSKGGSGVKYLQVKGSLNHVYFPKNFWETWKKAEFKILILTEGEKKAALACKLGIPCVAFGGVDSWRNRTIVVPKESEITTIKNSLSIKLPSANFDERWMSPYAAGFEQLLDMCRIRKPTLFICFDTDSPLGVEAGPQRAAARLGYELRYQGFSIEHIRQLILPYNLERGDGSGSLDNYLVYDGPEKLAALMAENMELRVAFPRHPSIREHISRKLQQAQIDRKQMIALSLAVITELDARGSRMYSPGDKQTYYFDGETKHLMPVNLNETNVGKIHETEFGKLLYKDYGIAAKADQRIMQWMSAQFFSEDPIESVSPHRTIARHDPLAAKSVLRYQINNGQYIKVTADPKAPYKILPNGAENILFESQTEELDAQKLIACLQKLHKDHKSGTPIPFWWHEVLKDVRLKHPGKYTELTALLYYLSPWLLRWKGLQLPVELIIGEAGSGKSTLCTLRLEIVHGKNNADLRNTPNDQKDWYAAIANSGGLHITDNVHMTDKNLRQRISDDLCRIITEPDPRIRIRKYFTEADERVIPVSSVFGFTALQQPFPNGDLIQRAMLLELAKLPDTPKIGPQDPQNPQNTQNEVVFDSYWKERQLRRFGGREMWVAHHLFVIHKLFERTETKWSSSYKSKHRLVGFEQALIILAELFGLEDAQEWIPQVLTKETNKAIEHADWALEGLAAFANTILVRQKKLGRPIEFDAAEIVTWAESDDDYKDCYQLQSSKSLGRYLAINKHTVQQIAGIVETSRRANKMYYTTTTPVKQTSQESRES